MDFYCEFMILTHFTWFELFGCYPLRLLSARFLSNNKRQQARYLAPCGGPDWVAQATEGCECPVDGSFTDLKSLWLLHSGLKDVMSTASSS